MEDDLSWLDGFDFGETLDGGGVGEDVWSQWDSSSTWGEPDSREGRSPSPPIERLELRDRSRSPESRGGPRVDGRGPGIREDGVGGGEPVLLENPFRAIDWLDRFPEGVEADGRRARGPCARNWVFTCNNFTPADVVIASNVDCGFISFQEEVGESGTPHLQGVVCFSKKTYFSTVRTLFGGAECRFWFAVMRGTPEQAVAYCRKSETRVPGGVRCERGRLPEGQGARSDLALVAQEVQRGTREDAIFSRYPREYLRYSGGIRRALSLQGKRRSEKTEVLWYFGPTGTGKSRKAAEDYPMAYWKSGHDHWWDGYEYEEAVIVDDYRADFSKFHFLLNLFDRYPLRVQVKGSSLWFCSKVIVITCNKSPCDIWANRCGEDIKQLLRRIDKVVFFTHLGAMEVAKDYKVPIVFN